MMETAYGGEPAPPSTLGDPALRRRDVIPFSRAVFEIARKEVLLFVRTKRLYVMGGIYALGFLALTAIFSYALSEFLGPSFEGIFGAGGAFHLSKANVVMSIAIFFPLLGIITFLNLLGLVFTWDGIVREYEDRSLFLILSKPINREALVLGKFVGAAFTLSSLFLGVATVAYFMAVMFVGEIPTPADMGRYFLGLGMITLGLLALSSFALFASAVSRTTAMSILLSISVWLIVLNMLAHSGSIYAAITQQIGQDPWYIKATNYLGPSTAMGPAFKIMMNLEGMQEATGASFELPLLFGGLGLDPLIATFSLLAFTGVFLFATMWVVNKRNFE